ncbi:uncharacterized protein BDZ83DRAFT_797670 [Colletotrichum acutatum]|uniref:Ubiquitin-like domain-containing protein n=1 Tax=Glomerella acutata TaxID=27357 RepID=A0AAD8U5Y1_GLOAC|nr:uncharacterized protein BDZ83DRAFT_797670 [Colletotrichum acutatum]KAK1707348.1 hypothetical protein BDZ83DRAFT_797670 [Colletotrichum acutatum]
MSIKLAIQAESSFYPDQQMIIYTGRIRADEETLRECSVIENATFHWRTNMHGAKPAIYLFSPIQLNNVDVKVSAEPDGTLEDTATGVKCSYLFWEADTFADPLSDVTKTHGFNPQNPLAYFADTYVLSFDDFVPYLDRTLTSLALTPAMRTEMIVYWLPKFRSIRDRGLQIAFNFIPQTDFERAAKGVVGGKDEDNRAKLESLDWPSMVGIDVDVMEDQGKFCVMEWGGMEVNMELA